MKFKGLNTNYSLDGIKLAADTDSWGQQWKACKYNHNKTNGKG